jgi:diamine N-acetyltransferase
MDITLRPVTRQAFDRVIDLKTTPEQEAFVASNLYSLAESAIEPDWTPLAICAGEKVVGFAMYGQEADAGRWWIIRFMIGAEHQGKGYGAAALSKLIALMTERHAPREIFLGYEPGNGVAERLYARFGFEPTGEMEEGEIIARLEVG